MIRDSVRAELHAYMATVLKNLKCMPLLINSVEDHVHVLFDLSRTICVSDVVQELKTTTSKWMKSKGHEFAKFAWQAGYGAFAVSKSRVETVRIYIANQQEHHRKRTFQSEFRTFLRRHGIEFDEQYVWD